MVVLIDEDVFVLFDFVIDVLLWCVCVLWFVVDDYVLLVMIYYIVLDGELIELWFDVVCVCYVVCV